MRQRQLRRTFAPVTLATFMADVDFARVYAAICLNIPAKRWSPLCPATLAFISHLPILISARNCRRVVPRFRGGRVYNITRWALADGHCWRWDGQARRKHLAAEGGSGAGGHGRVSAITDSGVRLVLQAVNSAMRFSDKTCSAGGMASQTGGTGYELALGGRRRAGRDRFPSLPCLAPGAGSGWRICRLCYSVLFFITMCSAGSNILPWTLADSACCVRGWRLLR